ncbi:hypothetical protein [Chamaesiphon sp. VAR_48_metabat_135_sub]|uniref:hypothetical protein n=1 Tax=Chamaesiphon sp. VAR_48_metabat_135_sub TaxID=2964699 RepID=UPI00286C7DD5|nr:hypothetical protein [Chamaesiphon sp. VAR_48_metabat_135_sub]
MELTQIISTVRELSSTDRLLLLQFLVNDLVRESGLTSLTIKGDYPESNQNIPISYGLHDSFEAAAILAIALAAKKATVHG